MGRHATYSACHTPLPVSATTPTAGLGTRRRGRSQYEAACYRLAFSVRALARVRRHALSGSVCRGATPTPASPSDLWRGADLRKVRLIDASGRPKLNERLVQELL